MSVNTVLQQKLAPVVADLQAIIATVDSNPQVINARNNLATAQAQVATIQANLNANIPANYFQAQQALAKLNDLLNSLN